MPGRRCAVVDCNNSFENCKKRSVDVSFHCFPKDETRKNLWVKACRRYGNWNPNRNSAICSEHFQSDDFELNFNKQLLNCRKSKRHLKEQAIPSLLKNTDTEHSATLKAREALISEYESKKASVVDEHENERQDHNVFEEYNQLKEKYKVLETTNNEQALIIEKLNQKLKDISDKYFIEQVKCTNLKETLKKVFTEAQIEQLIGQKMKVVWSSAFTI